MNQKIKETFTAYGSKKGKYGAHETNVTQIIFWATFHQKCDFFSLFFFPAFFLALSLLLSAPIVPHFGTAAALNCPILGQDFSCPKYLDRSSATFCILVYQ